MISNADQIYALCSSFYSLCPCVCFCVCFRSSRHWSKMNRPRNRGWRIKWSRLSQPCLQRAETHRPTSITKHTLHTPTETYCNRSYEPICNTRGTQKCTRRYTLGACMLISKCTHTQCRLNGPNVYTTYTYKKIHCTYTNHCTHQTTDRPKARLFNPMSSFFQKKVQQANIQLLKRLLRQRKRENERE